MIRNRDGALNVETLVAYVDDALSCSAVGGPESIRKGLDYLVAQTGADELILTAQIFDHAARRRSFEIVAEAWGLAPSDVPA